MNLSKLARLFGQAAVVTRDVNAVKRGRIVQRIGNRVVGRAISKSTRRLWF